MAYASSRRLVQLDVAEEKPSYRKHLPMRLASASIVALVLATSAHASPPNSTAIPTSSPTATPTPTPSPTPTATIKPLDPHPRASAGAHTGTERALNRPLGTVRMRIVAAARRWLGKRFGGDCSAFVQRVYADVGVRIGFAPPAETASEALFRASTRVQRPVPGDLAFFHDTHGPVRKSRRAAHITHVAVVEAVEGPVVSLVHRGGRGIERIFMNLARRHDPDENSILRRPRAGDPPSLRILAGELFAAFGSPPALGPDRRQVSPLRKRARHPKVASEP